MKERNIIFINITFVIFSLKLCSQQPKNIDFDSNCILGQVIVSSTPPSHTSNIAKKIFK